jgi:hypothetical protein
MTAPELKPCPFCGGEAHDGHRDAYSIDSSFNFIGCKNCLCMIEYDDPSWDARNQCWNKSSLNDAITAWNTRAQPSHDAALALPEIAALVEAAQDAEYDMYQWIECAEHLTKAGFNMDGTPEVAAKLSRARAALQEKP